ncbi:multiple epidermal growth factor-like domains protein 9 isoform X1 [Scleropages formosus]|uniref:Multiple epidermal growth factor-like domains protein 9 n=1 Tax=Scleropages formosus TaxID=113540 RepID=A0A8C9V0T8_SCLFO|nr:multiple epidermal growth factor-like domains protein 9 isoform X1 [Scleropages formosus]
MKRRSLAMMIAALAVELGLFLCAAGVAHAAPRGGDSSSAWTARRHPREAPGTTTGPSNESLPNHLLEEKPVAPAEPAIAAADRAAAVNVTGLNGTYVLNAATVASRAPGGPAVNVTAAPALPRSTSQWGESSSSAAVKATLTTKSQPVEFPCNCSSEGALDPEDCDGTTGQCSCLPGYIGLQCDTCEDGYFNNGSTGCLPCGCDSFGAVDHLCNSSGMCTCKMGVYGPQCDDCQPGYFRFSSTGCQPCQCHNHSSYCHPQSGICLECQGNTQGPACEECKPGFYRGPGAAQTNNCLPCPCSTLTSTSSCHFEASGLPVCDKCKAGYNGTNCNHCADGFYMSAGVCLPCNCSDNADPLSFPRLCDPVTGNCLRCTNHTAGPRCEYCAPGYFGNALGKGCFQTEVRLLPFPENTMEAMTVATISVTPSTNSSLASSTPNNSTESTTPLITSTTVTVTQSTIPSTTPTVFTSTSVTPTITVTTSTAPTTTMTTTLSNSLGSPTDNTTAAEAAISWAQFNIIILAVIIVAVVLLMGVAAAVYMYREYRNRKLNAPFWTIELKEDNISFSSYHDSLPNADVSGLLEGEGGEVAPSGQLALSSPANMYKA